MPSSLTNLARRAGTKLRLTLRRLARLPYDLLILVAKVVNLEVNRTRAQVLEMGVLSVESISCLGVEVRRMTDTLNERLNGLEHDLAEIRERLESSRLRNNVEMPFVFRALGTVAPPAPVLVLGPAAQRLADSLQALGYEATCAEAVGDLDGSDRTFGAVVLLSDRSSDNGALGHVEGLLAPGGLVVTTSVIEPGSVPPVPAGWEPVESALVGTSDRIDWVPMEEGEEPERAVALLAARMSTS